MNNNATYPQNDIIEEQSDVVERIYAIEAEYKEELQKPNPDRDKMVKLLNKQLMNGLKLQQYPMF